MRDLLFREGQRVGRLHVSTLMKRMGFAAIYRRPCTSNPAPGHKIYPYLLRKLPIVRSNQVWAIDITYIPMVCVLPMGHPLAAEAVIESKGLAGAPFISFDLNSLSSRRIASLLDAHGVAPKIETTAGAAPILCEFVAAGIGVSPAHPFVVSGLHDRLVIWRFEPAVQFDFQLCAIRTAGTCASQRRSSKPP